MKKGIWVFGVAVLILGLLGSGCVGAGKSVVTEKRLKPVVVAYPGTVTMDKRATLVLMGTGFQPGQKINLVMATADGVESEIGSSFETEPVADQRGAWAAEWKACGRYISRKLIKAGAYTILVTDEEYRPIAHVPVAFVAKKEKKEKKK